MPLQTQTSQPEPLRWLFVAHFADGHKIHQDKSDRSLTCSDGTGSAFSDVLAYDKAPIVAFELCGYEDQSVLVDMLSGSFMINGVPFHAHNQYFDPEKYPLELVYFRENRLETDAAGTPQRHYTNRYFIGWKTIINGKSKQVTIAVG